MTSTTAAPELIRDREPDDSSVDLDVSETELRRRPLTWLVPATAYLILAIAVWWNVWSTHPTSISACPCGDAGLVTWFLAWPAYAIAHGLNPFYSSAMFHPTGINLLSNASSEAVGIVLAPVTWLFGPIATLNVALTLVPFLSALSMFWLVRRWVSWLPAAFLGGLIYGFSPYVITEIAIGHVMSAALFVPPLIVGLLDELIFRRQRPPFRIGVGIGVLVVVQFFMGTEILAIMGIGAVVGLALLLGYGLIRRHDVLSTVRRVATGLGGAVAVCIPLLAYPAWFALAGPAHLGGRIWGAQEPGIQLRNLYSAPHPGPPSWLARLAGYVGAHALPPVTYLGLGLVLIILIGTITFRRDKRLLFFCALGVAGAVFALDRPSRILGHLPLLQNIIPPRLTTITLLSVSIALALVLDHTRDAILDRAPRSAVANPRSPLLLAAGGAAVIALIGAVPMAQIEARVLPLPTAGIVIPPWFTHTAKRLPPGTVALVAEPGLGTEETLVWQAEADMHFAIVEGAGPESRSNRMPLRERPGYRVLQADLSSLPGKLVFSTRDVTAVRRALQGWGVTTIVLPGVWLHPRPASAEQVLDTAVMTDATGRVPAVSGEVLVWRTIRSWPRVASTSSQFAQCTTIGMGTDRLQAEARCLLGSPR